MKISFVCHSPDASGSGIFLQKDCGQAAMTALNTYFRVNDTCFANINIFSAFVLAGIFKVGYFLISVENIIYRMYYNYVNKMEMAASLFNEGFNCSQVLLTAYGVELGLNREVALKIASAFGGGMGRMGDTCGAVTGAFMLIGLKYGTANTDKNSKMKIYGLVEEFAKRFVSRNNSIVCRELVGIDVRLPESSKIIKEKCPKYIRDACEIIEGIL